jgi:hypothetical protein
MSAKLRLVVYRPATSSATSDTAYNLDLQEHPSVSLNFQFSDIKEPETRKASYSQTFKLPFTDNNNEFFQNWFNVNLTTLVFSTRAKFDAVLYVGTVPQFEGFIQLKAVYQKAQMYEVVLMSNTADLFSVIGETPLKDVFLNEDDSYSDELNHTFNETQMLNSWNGATTDFVNTSAVSLRDADAGVQKVMYPTSVTHHSFFYDPTVGGGGNPLYGKYLYMSEAAILNMGTSVSNDYVVPITQFRPAIQLRTLFKLILARAGFSYTSTFIDSNYFGKLFMTTCNHLADAGTPTTLSGEIAAGIMQVGTYPGPSGSWGSYNVSLNTTDCLEVDFVPFPGVQSCSDDQDLWNSTYRYFTKAHPTMTSILFRTRFECGNIDSCDNSGSATVTIIVQRWDTVDNVPIDTIYSTTTVSPPTPGTSGSINGFIYTSLDISDMPQGASARILLKRSNFEMVSNQENVLFRLGDSWSSTYPCSMTSYIEISWSQYNNGVYNNIINIPACIDDSITQKDFLKDIIQRFNLIVLTDPDDASNIIIEPYNDYLAAGSIKHWTEKLDISKEIIVKDTTSLQKKTIHLTDLEDNDLLNKEFKENQPEINVYGHKKIKETNNDFAKGEMKNDPIFSPYINGKVYKVEGSPDTYLDNMTAQYEYSYKLTEDEDVIENPLTETKPKLFFYNGGATTVKDTSGDTVTYYLHNQPGASAINTYDFTTYPVCTPFDITPVDNAYTLTPDTKSLYWSEVPPLVGALTIFNYTGDLGTWKNNTLYGLYWEKYLNSVYGASARIMEAYIMLDAVDIFNFKFNDEIFIKDTYWRILNIHNYQVGGTVSTKVTLLKIIDSLILNEGCDYVIGYNADGNNTWFDMFYLWCSSDNADCTPDTTSADQIGLYTQIPCCTAAGGQPMTNITDQEDSGLYPCLIIDSPLPIRLRSLLNSTAILNQGQARTIISSKMGGRNRPLIKGTANTKLNQPLLNYFGDDIVIKYNTKNKTVPQVNGESHRIVLSGYTEGDTRGYAYAEGTVAADRIYIPINSNMIIRVKGIATVIGGKSATYTLGTTEAFAYYTAFKNINNTITQLSTVGGQQEFSIREGANPTTCTLNIAEDTSTTEIQFGLDDSQTDTKRVWALTVDLDVQQLINLQLPYGENWALWQDGNYIHFQNYNLLVWN